MRRRTTLICIIISTLLTLTGCELDNNANNIHELEPRESARTYRSIEELWLFLDDAHLRESGQEGIVELTLQFANWYTEDMWDVSFYKGGGTTMRMEQAPDDVLSWAEARDDYGNRLIPKSYVDGGLRSAIEYSDLDDTRKLTLEISETRDYFLQVQFIDRFNPIILNLRDIVDELKNTEWIAMQQFEGIYLRITPETDVALIVKEITPSDITFIFDNPTYRSYIYGFPYEIFVRRGNLWARVEPLDGTWFAFFLPGFTLAPRSTTEHIERSWESVAGILSPGEYKFRKSITYHISPGNNDEYVFDIIFTLQ